MRDENEFKVWLNGRSDRPYQIKDGYTTDFYLKAYKNKDFVYLYNFRDYRGSGIERHKDLEYAGMYCRITGLVYEAHGSLSRYFPEIEYSDGANMMAETVTVEVRAILNQRINDDPTCLGIKSLSPEYLGKLQNYYQNQFVSDVRQSFLNYESSDTGYKSHFSFDREWRDSDLMEYILQPEKFIMRQADLYMQEHAEDILLELKERELINNRLKELENMEDSSLHRLRNIQAAVKGISAKTLWVKIEKDDIEFEFKTEASELIRNVNGMNYSIWSMPYKDREEFRQLFGKNGSYYPEDITEISYCGKKIYEAEALESAPTESMIQQM